MTRLEKRIRKLNKQIDIFFNKLVKPIINALKPLMDIFIDAMNPLLEILKHECYQCYDSELCELQELDYPIINCKYFKEIDAKELKLIDG